MLKLLFQALLGITLVAIALPAQAAQLHEPQLLRLIKREAIVREHLRPQDVRVSWQDLPINVLVPFVPDGPLSLSIPPSAHLGGRENVPVQIVVNGQPFRTIFPRVDVAVLQRVLVATAPIQEGAYPSPESVALKEQAIDAQGMYGTPLTSLDQLDGAVAVRDISAGTPLDSQMFRIPPLVKVGDTVNVTLQDGDLTLVTTGLSQGSGTRGQVIRVLNAQSHKVFMARITGPRAVSVTVEDQP